MGSSDGPQHHPVNDSAVPSHPKANHPTWAPDLPMNPCCGVHNSACWNPTPHCRTSPGASSGLPDNVWQPPSRTSGSPGAGQLPHPCITPSSAQGAQRGCHQRGSYRSRGEVKGGLALGLGPILQKTELGLERQEVCRPRSPTRYQGMRAQDSPMSPQAQPPEPPCPAALSAPASNVHILQRKCTLPPQWHPWFEDLGPPTGPRGS